MHLLNWRGLLLATMLIGLCFAGLFLSDPHAGASAPKLTLTVTRTAVRDYHPSFIGVKSLPYASLTIVVIEPCGARATSRSLKGIHTADSLGRFTWAWTPESRCHGRAWVTLTAKENGQTKTLTDRFGM